MEALLEGRYKVGVGSQCAHLQLGTRAAIARLHYCCLLLYCCRTSPPLALLHHHHPGQRRQHVPISHLASSAAAPSAPRRGRLPLPQQRHPRPRALRPRGGQPRGLPASSPLDPARTLQAISTSSLTPFHPTPSHGAPSVHWYLIINYARRYFPSTTLPGTSRFAIAFTLQLSLQPWSTRSHTAVHRTLPPPVTLSVATRSRNPSTSRSSPAALARAAAFPMPCPSIASSPAEPARCVCSCLAVNARC